MAVYLFDPDGGNNANDGLTFANRKKDWNGMGNGVAGDEWRVMAARDPHSLGNAQWTNGSNVVTLATAKNVTVDNCDAAFTGNTSVTGSTQTASALARAWRQGTAVSRLAVVAAFNTGFTPKIVGYKALGATLDLSAYRAISMRIAHSIAIASGVLRLDLCSDAVGAVPVASLLLPTSTLASAGYNLFVDYGAALPSNVNSIAIYATAAFTGAVNIDMDNIIACHELGHADHLCHDSLIGKETVGESEMWPIRSIDGTTITLGAFEVSGATVGRTFPGVSETVTTYAQQTQVLLATPTGGQDVAYKLISGGWNRTDMSTRGTTDTFLSGRGACSYAYQRTTPNAKFDQFSFTGFVSGVAHYSTLTGDIQVKGKHASGNGGIVAILETFSKISFDYMVMNTIFGTAGSLNQYNVRAEIKSKLWGECNSTFWSATTDFGLFGADQASIELGTIRNTAGGYSCVNYSNAYGAMPLKNTVFTGNTQEIDNRYSYNFENVTFARTVASYWGSLLPSKLVYSRKAGDSRICGWATYNTCLEVQTANVPATGDTAAWRYITRLNIVDTKYPRVPFLSFGVEVGKTYTVEFDFMRSTTSSGFVGRVEAQELTAAAVAGYADTAGAGGTWTSGSFTFVAAATGPVNLYLAKPVDVGSTSASVYAANVKVTES